MQKGGREGRGGERGGGGGLKRLAQRKIIVTRKDNLGNNALEREKEG